MRLYLFDLGWLDLDRRVIMPAGPPGQRLLIPVPAYLIDAGEDGLVLVDTGISRAVLAGDHQFGGVIRPVETQGAFVTDRLAALGIEPSRVTHVVATHFHFDHAGGLGEFGHATIVAQRAAVEAARAGSATERAAVERPGLRWRLVDGDTDLLPGVRLLESSGHTRGHQSVLVRLGSGRAFLLAIDAIYNREQLAADDWGAYRDPVAARASARKVQELAAETGATLVYGHDAEQWRSLQHAPDFYE